MTSNMPIADAEELAQWFTRHMSMEQRHKLMSERPLLYARTFPGVSADTITARVRDALDAQDTVQVQFPGSDKFPGSGNVATVPAGLAEDAVQSAEPVAKAVMVRRGDDVGELRGWTDRDTALVRFSCADAVEVPVSELRTAHDLRPVQPVAPAKKTPPPGWRDPWI